MSPADKQYEDSFNQGGNGKDPAKTDVPNHVTDAPRKDVIPDSTVVFGPVNIPKHVFEDQWQAGEAPKKASPTGISLGVLTVRNEERASRLAKELFAKKLVAEVQVQEGGFHRSYLKFGKIETEVSRARMTLVTTDDKIAELIEYINHENPDDYDYPVPDLMFTPIARGNDKYVSWV